jgi:biopolymer transport protein ExbD
MMPSMEAAQRKKKVMTPADYDAQRRVERRAMARLRRGSEGDDVNFLNITAMMDMMTILLVFMLKSLSTQNSNVTMSDQLSLPNSGTTSKATDTLSVTITKSAVLVDGEPVVPVHLGTVDSSYKSGGGTGLIITPLFNNLKNHATMHKMLAQTSKTAGAFEGELTIIADKTTPYRLITEVLYTAGEAEYGKYRLVVLEKER